MTLKTEGGLASESLDGTEKCFFFQRNNNKKIVESESIKVVGGYKDRMVKMNRKLVAEGPML